jgi:type IV pilus assembly protein PilA
MARSPHGKAASRGFTLIELMIVVAIIGVVAALASVGYFRWISSSKMAEGTNMVAGIKSAQENYFTQVGQYYDLSKGILPSNLYPQTTPGPQKVPWGGPCSGCNTDKTWEKLGVKADGPVYFGYATIARAEGVAPTDSFPLSTGAVNWAGEAGSSTWQKPWFIATAMADTNGNGKFAKVVGMSFNSRLIVDLEGE